MNSKIGQAQARYFPHSDRPCIKVNNLKIVKSLYVFSSKPTKYTYIFTQIRLFTYLRMRQQRLRPYFSLFATFNFIVTFNQWVSRYLLISPYPPPCSLRLIFNCVSPLRGKLEIRFSISEKNEAILAKGDFYFNG